MHDPVFRAIDDVCAEISPMRIAGADTRLKPYLCDRDVDHLGDHHAIVDGVVVASWSNPCLTSGVELPPVPIPIYHDPEPPSLLRRFWERLFRDRSQDLPSGWMPPGKHEGP